MKIVTFFEIDDSVFGDKHEVEYFENCSGDASVAVIDITSIFDFEENKGNTCGDNFVSIAVIDDTDDYDAFKNFGIDAWIKHEDISKIGELIDILEKRYSL